MKTNTRQTRSSLARNYVYKLTTKNIYFAAYLHLIPPPRHRFHRHHHLGLKRLNNYTNNWMINSTVCPSKSRWLSVCMYVCLSACMYVCLSWSQSVCLEVIQLICLSVCLSFNLPFLTSTTRSIRNACRPVRCTYFHTPFWVLRIELIRPEESGESTAGEPVASSLLGDPWVRRIPTQTSCDHEYCNKQIARRRIYVKAVMREDTWPLPDEHNIAD